MNKQTSSNKFCVSAKLLLIGDAGTGKTLLGNCLAAQEVIESKDRIRLNIWTIESLPRTRYSNRKYNVALWEVPGQVDYRQLCPLYFDELDAVMILLDPIIQKDPWESFNYYWHHLISKKALPCILVGTKADKQTLDHLTVKAREMCRNHNIEGTFVPTSAIEERGIVELTDALDSLVRWEDSSNPIDSKTLDSVQSVFIGTAKIASSLSGKHEKYVIKEDEVGHYLKEFKPNCSITETNMTSAIKHLQKIGFLRPISNDFGKFNMLLKPSLLIAQALQFFSAARENLKGVGAFSKDRLFRLNEQSSELSPMPWGDQLLLIEYVERMFLEYGICFLVPQGNEQLIVFPHLIQESRPQAPIDSLEHETSFLVRASPDELYAILIVLLGETSNIRRNYQWKMYGLYELSPEGHGGIKLIQASADWTELQLLFQPEVHRTRRSHFRSLIETIMEELKLDYHEFQSCKCGTIIGLVEALRFVEGKQDILYCSRCGDQVDFSLTTHKRVYDELLPTLEGDIYATCYICYAWGIEEHSWWVRNLAEQLHEAKMQVIFDRFQNKPGTSIKDYVGLLDTTDYVIIIGTEQLMLKCNDRNESHVVRRELDQIKELSTEAASKFTIIPVLMEGSVRSSFPEFLHAYFHIDFSEPRLYWQSLWQLVVALRGFPSVQWDFYVEEFKKRVASQNLERGQKWP